MRPMPFFLTLLPLLSCSLGVLADGFGINATRLIYPQGANSIAVSVRNTQATLPYLVQTSVSSTPQSRVATPFTATPPLFRLEPQSISQIRIAGDDASLPKDRESVFYFHATAIPASQTPTTPQQTSGVQGAAQFGVGNIIKLFYRPAGLPSTSAAAQKNLQFSRTKSGLQVSNPSPYFVSLASLNVAGQQLKLETPAALMIAPYGSHTYATSAKHGSVEWQTINDQGGVDAFKHSLP
ncbi:Chaperone protein focC precursor [Serratia fonticola]|uniref:fimbrial biogenesis chaperone n=1 Tax=Serratia fonticola TaxID=47917 RepID=UPI00217C1DAA|nr:molecular chaperone [Serratia fonticola]CAI1949438.1 Chaperone protein focC precursor [Serratia fonticola]